MSELPGMNPEPDEIGMRCLAIRNWQQVFETSDSRRHQKLNWISEPLDSNSTFWLDLCEDFDDHELFAIYGAWLCICRAAARQPVRGVLVNSRGQRVTEDRIAMETRGAARVIRRTMVWAFQKGWLFEVTPEFLREELQEIERSRGAKMSDGTRRAMSIVCETIEKRHTPPNVTNQTPPPPNPVEAGRGWEDLENRVRLAGVDLSTETIEAAREFGASPEYVAEVLTHFESLDKSGWESPPGVLRNRLVKKGKLSLSPDKGWPPLKKPQAYAQVDGARMSASVTCDCGNDLVLTPAQSRVVCRACDAIVERPAETV